VIESPLDVKLKFPCTTKAKVEPVAWIPVGAMAPDEVTDPAEGTESFEGENVTFPAMEVG
jgi:hypothetical protein